MWESVALPVWLLVLILAFAAVTFASHFLFPSVRWFFRKRFERAVAQLNTQLARPIEPFKLMRRSDNINRLLYSPQVMEAVVTFAREEGVREDVAFERARRYAREIVPGFSTATYFGFSIKVARWLSRALYSVSIPVPHLPVDSIDPNATVVFVMNHRSNMDYVLVTWLVAEDTPLSYAVGEWARFWPLRSLIRAMGAYFIRRRYLNTLYRGVLARYVQMARDEGVTQAIFPEGGLSRDGTVGDPKLGLLSYLVEGFDPDGARDVVFLPVGLNYDRVFEDRNLVALQGERRIRRTWAKVLWAILPELWPILTGRQRFGQAAVRFGEPVSLKARLSEGADVAALGAGLTEQLRSIVPILPVPVTAEALLEAGEMMEISALEAAFESTRADFCCPAELEALTVQDGLKVLRRRGLVELRGNSVYVPHAARDVLRYYANSLPERPL
ncbi:MAG: 1-acyl-sn-glycerol-3-phosphate acyltransferase [Dinoroseobacter sp.]|nr:1-acyl-sn-glycerol-3-phosphate acyltransferase [Dinoroseobacter sp.]